MKPKSTNTPSDPNQAMSEIDKLPEKTKRLMELKRRKEKSTGTAEVEIQEKIQKHSRDE